MADIHDMNEQYGKPGERGTSVVELVILLTATVMLLASVLTGTVQHSMHRQANAEMALAMIACRNTIEELRSVPFDDLPTMHGVGFDVPGSNGQPGGLHPMPGDSDGLPGQIMVIVDQSVAGVATLYEVRVSVTWDGVHRTGQFSMVTLMGERK